MKRFEKRNLNKRVTAFVLAFLMAFNLVLPQIAEIVAYGFAIAEIGQTGNLQMGVNSYCIDDSEMVGGGL